MTQDPTHNEMITTLREAFGGLVDAESLDSDAAVAAYWFASDYHGGQSSNLYSALSTSPYSPGPFSSLESAGGYVEEMYAELEDKYAGS